MATVTDSDLKELKDLIIAQSAQMTNIQTQLGEVQSQVVDLKIGLGKIEGQIAGIDKRLDVNENRANSLTNWLIGILFALVGGLLGLLGKVTFFPSV